MAEIISGAETSLCLGDNDKRNCNKYKFNVNILPFCVGTRSKCPIHTKKGTNKELKGKGV